MPQPQCDVIRTCAVRRTGIAVCITCNEQQQFKLCTCFSSIYEQLTVRCRYSQTKITTVYQSSRILHIILCACYMGLNSYALRHWEYQKSFWLSRKKLMIQYKVLETEISFEQPRLKQTGVKLQPRQRVTTMHG